MPFCLQKQLRKQLTGTVKPSLLLLCHSWSPTSAPDTALSECRDSLDHKSRLPVSPPWLTASSEVKAQPQSLADWHSGAQSQTGQQCPRCWPREKATTCPSAEGTPELLFLHPQGYTGWISFPHYDRQLAWHTNIQSVPQVSKNASMSL